jgi:hypothetical protein
LADTTKSYVPALLSLLEISMQAADLLAALLGGRNGRRQALDWLPLWEDTALDVPVEVGLVERACDPLPFEILRLSLLDLVQLLGLLVLGLIGLILQHCLILLFKDV